VKIAVVEKTRLGAQDHYKEYFKFDYDLFQLTKSKDTKILKKDITLDPDFHKDYDLVVLIGKEPTKFIGKCTNVTKFAGHLVNGKFIPMLNPVAVKFNPGIKETLDGALTKLHNHINGTYSEVLGEYTPITDAPTAKDWILQQLHAHTREHLVVDIETSSLYPREGYILGIAMTTETMKGVYIQCDCIDEEIEELLQRLFDAKTLVFHNAKFDIKWLQYHFNFRFKNWHDVMLQHYLLNETELHDLKSLSMKYTKMGEYDHELEAFKTQYMKTHKIKVADFSYESIPFDIMWKYAAADTDATLRLFNKFNPIIQSHFKELYNSIMLRGAQFLLDIEEMGVPFSKEYLGAANVKFKDDIIELSSQLYVYPEVKEIEIAQGKEFNPGSPAQLAVLFFEKLGLPVIKKTPKGAPSTDKEVLAALVDLHPVAKLIGEIRSRVKLRSTYIVKVLKGLDNDSRLRTSFHLHTVTSGRLSSSGKLNMQQLPREDKTVKHCIRADKEGYVVFSQDLQTAEMYYAGALSGDKNLAKVFSRAGEDFHGAIAKMTFGLACAANEVKTIYPELRQAAKAVSFGILYGAGPGKVAETANISFKEAKGIIDKYFSKFSKLSDWLDTTRDEITSRGYVYSHFGRKRRVPNVFSVDEGEQGHALRSAMNFVVQSVASDVNLLGAMDAHDEFIKQKLRAEIFALVHDSIVGQCHLDDLEQVKKVLRDSVQKDRGVNIQGCPIGVDFGYGLSYGDAA
jgi:DNA polymerase I-like protein with 3'-5' exonuclease and polymerase domains